MKRLTGKFSSSYKGVNKFSTRKKGKKNTAVEEVRGIKERNFDTVVVQDP
ncbi:MAG: hypothetical protein ACTSW1_19035 [Candidatus Hodarchaeales archaeon]